MVEVLRRGTPKEERTYTVECKCCNSTLRFKYSEAHLTSDQRDGDFLSVACPVCKRTVHADARFPDPAART